MQSISVELINSTKEHNYGCTSNLTTINDKIDEETLG